METLTIESPIETTERLLIYSNDQEINRVRSEIEMRVSMLNTIARHGLSPEEIKNVCSSKFCIESFIENRLIQQNKEYARMKKAGIQVTATLSAELQSLKNALLAWESLKGNKYAFVTFADTLELDYDKLERDFEMRGIKVYLEGEQLEKWRKAEQLITLLKSFNIEWNHIASSPPLAKFIEANGQRIIPRWQYFKQP